MSAVTRCWVMLLVDPAEPVTCQLRFSGELQVTHLRHAAWLLEQVALGRRRAHFTGRGSFDAVSWTDEHSVALLEWRDDDCGMTFHGKPLSEFHLVSAAAALRERADTLAVQQAVLAVLQGYDQARQEARSAAATLEQVQGNGGPIGGKIILLGK